MYEPIPSYPIGPILTHLGAQLPAHIRGGWQKIPCPSPTHNDSNPSATVNFDINRVHCFGCGLNEDGIGLIQHVLDVDFKTAHAEAETITSGTSREIRQQSGSSWAELFE